MSALSALWYLETRQIVNRIRETLRQPARVALYVLGAAYFIVVGVLRPHGNGAIPAGAIPEPYASAAMFAFVALLGIVCYGAASGILGAFSSVADARFLTGSRASERIVVLWLQFRRCASAIARMLFTLALYALFWGTGTSAWIGVAVMGGTIVATAAAVPILKLRSTAGARTAQSLAAAIAVLGILPLLISLSSLVSPSVMPAAHEVDRLGAGSAFGALISGSAPALFALYGCGVILIAAAFASGTGLYPELYTASLRVLAFREKQKRGGAAAFDLEHTYQHAAGRGVRVFFDGLGGPWTIAWKEWIAFARSASMQRMFFFGAAACGICGGILGTVAANSKHPVEAAIGFAYMSANMVVIFVAMGSAIGLAADLRKPLWWMGPDPLWMRLFAWIAGTSWRMALCLAIGVVAWSAAMHLPLLAIAGIPLAVAVVLYLRAVGLALYAIFPSTIDQRGPLGVLRALLTYAFAAPPAIAAAVAGEMLHSAAVGMSAAIVFSLLETLALVAFASARISGRGVLFANAEAM